MSKSHLSPGHLTCSNFGTPIWLVALAQSWPLFPLSTSQEPPVATCTHIPYTSMGLLPRVPLLDPYTLLGGSHCSCYYPSWGGTREAQELFMSYTAIRARAEARILDSLFLKWQSFPNVSGFQTFFQSSFLPTIYSVMQLFADLLNPMKSHAGPIKH